uniref:Uncharacterized protein n=1 Tax=Solanum tuberosum TaxID=4113 RepID=M0ZKW0_SOLTU
MTLTCTKFMILHTLKVTKIHEAANSHIKSFIDSTDKKHNLDDFSFSHEILKIIF